MAWGLAVMPGWVVREGASEESAFEMWTNDHKKTWGKRIPGGVKSRSKGRRQGTRLVESWSRDSSNGGARMMGGQDPYHMAVSAAKKFLVYCFVSAFFHNLDFIFSALLPPISKANTLPSELVSLPPDGGGIILSFSSHLSDSLPLLLHWLSSFL